MNRPLLILISGLVLAALGFSGVYYACTAGHSDLEHNPKPVLSWLKEEFHLNDAEFARITKLHDQYLEGCSKRCAEIDAKNKELSQLLATNHTVTPDIERLLLESAQLRANCQKVMLQHFYEVSRTMPSEQGQRYLEWIQRQTILPDSHSTMHH